VRDSWGRTLTTAAAVVFGMALFWVYTSIYPITGSNIQSAAELVIPVFETADEEPTVNQSEDHMPKPVLLLPAPAETPPLKLTEMATNPQASEAVEVALQKPSAEAVDLTSDPVVPAAKSPWSESRPSGNTPALSQEDPAQSPQEPYVDETLLPVPPQTAPSEMPPSTEETSAPSLQPSRDLVKATGTSPQPLPPDLPVDAGTPHQPPASPGETISSSGLPADLSPFAEDTVYLE
jgi:hypothetical protein